MNPQRFAQVLGLSQTVVVAGLIGAGFGGFGSGGMQNTSAASIVDRRLPSLAAAVELAAAPRPAAIGHADVAAAIQSLTETASGPAASPDQAKPMLEAAPAASLPSQPPPAPTVAVAIASTPDPAPGVASEEPKPTTEIAAADPSQTPPPAAPALQLASANPSDLLPGGGNALSAAENPDACPADESCIDRYLWSIYQRTPKEDSIKVTEQRQVTVKKKGKMVTVTRSFTRLMDEDFGWKDPKAAERVGMQMSDYVIGGMDRSFRLKLFNLLRAAETAGLSPGITSAFRDDYRQSIASGLKAASDRSYHGGSSRGGYGHGLAADVVSIKGETRDQRYASSEAFWNWIDKHGEEFGIGRPYLDRDPPHVAPIDGKEYASHRGTKTHAESSSKKHGAIAARGDHNLAKRSKTARSSRVKTT